LGNLGGVSDEAAPPHPVGGPAALADPHRLAALARTYLGPAPDEALDRFARLVSTLLHVPVALVSLVTADRQVFPGAVGLPEPWASRRETPLSHSFCQHVVGEARPMVFPDARIYARVRDNRAIPDLGVVAYAGMPLTDLEGRVLGSLCAIDDKPRAWTPDELATLEDLAAACSSELRMRIAVDTARAAHDRIAMLSSLTESLVSTLDIDEALGRLAEAVVPRLADWCVVNLADGAGAPHHVASAHRDPTLSGTVRRFAEQLPQGLREGSLMLSVLRTGVPVRRIGQSPDDIRAGQASDEMAAMAERLGYASVVVVPITSPGTRGTVLGAVTFLNGPERPPFTDADLRAAVDIGARAGLAVDNSRRYEAQRHVAEVFQHSMLTSLPVLPGLDLHARYVPAAAGAEVGGDWYDAFVQPEGDVMLAVGDVAGHDVEAAAVMGQLRNLVRGDAYGRDDSAGDLLAQLDRAVLGLDVPASATLFLARLSGHELAWSNAGHPPPMVLHEDGRVEVLTAPVEPLLGLTRATARTTHRAKLPPGATLLLYTDGLVETRRRGVDVGIALLAERLAGLVGLATHELCDEVLRCAASSDDDIAVLVARVTA
jgi:GAF domain-containing protein